MKKQRFISYFIILTLTVVSLKITGCEQEDVDSYVDCDLCLSEYPEWDTLWVTVTINDENPFVPLEFYIGDYEDGEIDWTDTAYSESFWLLGEIEKQYSVKASYHKDGDILIAIDGDFLSVTNVEDECYPPCKYYISGGTLDVSMKE